MRERENKLEKPCKFSLSFNLQKFSNTEIALKENRNVEPLETYEL